MRCAIRFRRWFNAVTSLGVLLISLVAWTGTSVIADDDGAAAPQARSGDSTVGHPDTSAAGWQDLFAQDLSDTIRPRGVWTIEDGALTASADQAIWTQREYENFILDLEFKNASGTNSGVIVYCTDVKNWIPNSVEIQIADDFHPKWSQADKTWQCGAIFGHLAAAKRVVRKPGQWNRFTITCRGQRVTVIQNGALVTDMDMSKWTSATKNPDGSDIPPWLNRPFAELATKGRIGLQGKHGDATVWFRNVRIRQL